MTNLDDSKQMEYISEMLDTALDYGFEVEVIFFALKYMKEHPQATPAESFAVGLTEWVK